MKKTYANSTESHHKEIHSAIALSTILYLLTGVSYTLTQSIIRLIAISFVIVQE